MTRPLFVTPGDGSIRCALCPDFAVRKWNHVSTHGLAHVDRGEATATSDPYCPPTSGHRYVFTILDKKQDKGTP